MINAHHIFIKPIMSEKSLSDRGLNKYLFWVDYKATKNQIKQAFYHLFKVKPLKINTIKLKSPSKFSWRTKSQLKSKNFKKAIITLSSKDKIDILSIKK
mgnify:CR=1 FL=1